MVNLIRRALEWVSDWLFLRESKRTLSPKKFALLKRFMRLSTQDKDEILALIHKRENIK